ncbi:MAG: ankyrin repeat domain-containing protein [Bdellovibrionota bacterium]|nr:ankyrin repeat domain-containing protein [Bdellovibrionota bacterium]
MADQIEGNQKVMEGIVESLHAKKHKEVVSLIDQLNWSEYFKNEPLIFEVLSLFENEPRLIEKVLESDIDLNVRSSEWVTPLHWVCSRGNENFIKFFLQKGVNVNVTDKNESTPLHEVCKGPSINGVRLLVKAGANVLAKDRLQRTALHIASSNKSIKLDMVKDLLANGININEIDKNVQTPLHYACEEENTNLVKLLLNAGGYVNSRGYYNITPLHVACGKNNLPLVDELIHAGAYVDLKNDWGLTPLDVARKSSRDKRIVPFLLKEGIKCGDLSPKYFSQRLTKIKEYIDNNDFDALEGEFRLISWNEEYEGEAILFAILKLVKTRPDLIALMKKWGADLDVKKKFTKNTPLHLALDESIDMVKELVKGGADVNASGLKEQGPLHYACSKNDFEAAKVFIDAGADVDQRSYFLDSTPLVELCRRDKADERIISYLIGKGANVNAKGKEGMTSLHQVAKRGDWQIAKVLINSGADYHWQDDEGQTPLHVVENVKTAQLLLQKGADKESCDRDGRTPLHKACESENINLVQFLIREGAKINVEDEHGETPLDIARKAKNEELQEILERAGGKGKKVVQKGFAGKGHYISIWDKLRDLLYALIILYLIFLVVKNILPNKLRF